MIITIASLKGGVGKTTTAVHLAAFLQNQADTLLIDADPNRSAIGWAKRSQFPFEVVDEWRSPAETRKYDHLVIDTPARPNREELSVLVDSGDLMIIPTTADLLALDALVVMLECLNHVNPNRYRILLTMVSAKPSRDVDQVRTMLAGADFPLFGVGIRNLAVFQKAAQSGLLVYQVKDAKAQEGWQDYQEVGQELLAMVGL